MEDFTEWKIHSQNWKVLTKNLRVLSKPVNSFTSFATEKRAQFFIDKGLLQHNHVRAHRWKVAFSMQTLI